MAIITRSRSRRSKSPSSPSSSPISTENIKAGDINISTSNINSTPAKRTHSRSSRSSSSSSAPKTMPRPRKKIKVEQTLDNLLNKSYQRKPVDWSAIHERITSHPQEVETRHLSIALMITKPTVVPPNVVRDLVQTSKNIFTFSALQFAFTCPWIEDETIRALIDAPLEVKSGRLRFAIEQSGGRVGQDGPSYILRHENEAADGDDMNETDTDSDDNIESDPAQNSDGDSDNDTDFPFSIEDIAIQIIKQSKLHAHCSNLLHTLFQPTDYLPPRFDAVKIMLECMPKVLEIKDSEDESDHDLPLHSACWSDRNSEYIELFVDTALGIESPVYSYGGLLATNKYGITPMKIIVQKWDDEKGASMIKKLINHTNMNGTEIANAKLLHEAVNRQKWAIAKTIIEASPTSLSKTGSQWKIPLHELCTLPETSTPTTTLNSDIIQFMIEQGILHHKDHTTCGGLITADWSGKTPMCMLSSSNQQTSGASMNIIKNILKFIHSKRKVKTKLYLSVIIHKAIKIKEWELTTHIIQTYPKALLLKDENDNLPIHFLCKSDAPLEVIKMAIKKGLEEKVFGKKKRAGLLEVNKANEKPIELIVARKCTSNGKVLKSMQEDFETKLITKKDIKDFKLLHKASNGGRSAVARMLLKMVPKAISIRDDEGNLPLHIALNASPNKANRDVVKMLIENGIKESVGGVSGHGGLMVTNDKSEAPIDHVLEKLERRQYGYGDKRWNYMNILLKHAPDTPVLHRAIDQLKFQYSLIDNIVERYPKSAAKRDENGQLPLQVALEKGTPSYCVKAIMDENPSALEEFESSTGLPCFALAASKSPTRNYSLDFGFEMLIKNPTFFSSQHWGE